MGIKNLFRGIARKFAVRPRDQRNEEINRFFRVGSDNTNISETESNILFDTNASIGLSIGLISGKAADIKPIIKVEKSKETILNHPVTEFLKKPNLRESYFEFMESLTTNFLIHNNSFFEVTGFFKSKPIEIYPLGNTWVTITQRANAAVYKVTSNNFFQFLSGTFNLDRTDTNILSTTKVQEIRHVKGFSLSSSGMRAASKLASLKMDAELINQSKKHNVNLLREGFNAPGFFSVDTQDREAFDQFRKDVFEKFSGSGNARKPMIARAGKIDFKDFGQSNKDMEYTKTKMMSDKTIFERYEIPGPLHDSKVQTLDNYQTAIFTLYDQAVLPLLNRIFMDLTELFQQRGMLKENEMISFDPASVSALRIRFNSELESLRKANIASTNELRTTVGYEKSTDKQADVIYQPSTLIPLSFDTFTGDNLEVPSKSYIDSMIKSGFSKKEAVHYWHEFKRTSKN